jgi:hypothetical protein
MLVWRKCGNKVAACIFFISVLVKVQPQVLQRIGAVIGIVILAVPLMRFAYGI